MEDAIKSTDVRVAIANALKHNPSLAKLTWLYNLHDLVGNNNEVSMDDGACLKKWRLEAKTTVEAQKAQTADSSKRPKTAKRKSDQECSSSGQSKKAKKAEY